MNLKKAEMEQATLRLRRYNIIITQECMTFNALNRRMDSYMNIEKWHLFITFCLEMTYTIF
jgi:hypothetical protein